MFGFSTYSLMGFCLGFMLGVGCALAVMYSIFMGGYRAALDDSTLDPRPKRLLDELDKQEKSKLKRSVRA